MEVKNHHRNLSIPAFFGNTHSSLGLFIAILSIWLWTSGLAFAGSTVSNPIIISNYTLISVTPAGGKNYDFAYRATATNKGKTALSSLVMTLTAACKSSFSAIDAELSFGPIARGKSAISTDTFTIRKSGSTPWTAKKLNDGLKWQIATNGAPTANAGPDQTVPRTGTVQLNGTGIDPNGDALSYRWRLVPPLPAGSLASLLNPTTPTPSFNVDARGTWIAELIVNDGKVDSLPDTVAISTVNSAPVANAAGPQTVVVGSNPVTLDGTGSTDADGDQLTYQWTFTDWPGKSTGSTAPTLSTTAPASPDRPTFVVSNPGTYVVQLVVNDGQVNSAPASVTITTSNSAPVALANVSPSPVYVGDTITLDASGSTDVDGNALTYTWSLTTTPSGSNAGKTGNLLVSVNAYTSTFIADKAGTYIAQVLVSDGQASSTANVTLSTTNSAPKANAGPDQSVYVGTGIPVQLDGSASSDADLDPLSFSWSFSSYPGSTAPGATPPLLSYSLGADKPSFLVNNPGNYTLQLIVNDTHVDSVPDTVVISTLNSRPVAVPEFTPATPKTGDTVTLNGSASTDADHDTLTYHWSILNQPTTSNVTLTTTTDPTQSTLVPQIAGDYVAQLIVNDGTLDSLPVTATITVASVAPTTTTVPNVVGQTQATATTLLTATNLTVGTVTQQNSATVATGNVISQSPVASTTVALGSAVNLVISSGPANFPPTIVSTPNTAASVGTTYNYTVRATDLNIADVLYYNLTSAPAGMTINSTTGVISWIPSVGQIGTQSVTVTVSDGLASDSQNFSINVSLAVPLIPVPDLTGQTLVQATQSLNLSNLIVGDVMTAFSDGSAFKLTYSGTSDPTLGGFSVDQCCAASNAAPLANDLGHAAWSISGQTTASQLGYVTGALSPTQQSVLASQGFALTFVARVSKGLAPAYDTINHITIAGATYETAARRFEVDLGLDSAGDTVVVLPTSIDNGGPGLSVRSPGPSFTLSGSGSSYHTYQLVYNPTTQLANLWVDGIERIQNYAGHTSFAINRGLIWSAWSGGQGNFSSVELASPVPAYSTSVVKSQNPVAGTPVASGSLVDLILASSGPAQVTIPNVVGLTQDAATTALTSAGLMVGTITQQASSTVPAGNVISQSPAAGVSVVSGSVVSLVVSSGSALITVPDVVGQNQAAASTSLTGGGLTLGTVTQQASSTVPAGDVISQLPVAGTSVPVGTLVDLVVSSGSAQCFLSPIDLSITPSNIGNWTVTAGGVTGPLAVYSTNFYTPLSPIGVTIGSPTGPFSGYWQADYQFNLTAVEANAVQMTVDWFGADDRAVLQLNGVNLYGAGISSPGTGSMVLTEGGTLEPWTFSANIATKEAIASPAFLGYVGPIVFTPKFLSGTNHLRLIVNNTGAGIQGGLTTAGPTVAAFLGSISCRNVSGVLVPNVVGLSQASATTTMTSAGFTVGTITQQASSTVPAGNVISQSPAAGLSVVSGSVVALVVSSGSALCALAPIDIGITSANLGNWTATSGGITGGLVPYAPGGFIPANLGQFTGYWQADYTFNLSAADIDKVQMDVSQLWADDRVVLQVNGVNIDSTGIYSPGIGVMAFTEGGPYTPWTFSTKAPASFTPPLLAGSNHLRLIVNNTGTGILGGLTPRGPTNLFFQGTIACRNGSGILVPNVVGKAQTTANTDITNAGLIVGAVNQEASSTVAAGSVISQIPIAGTAVSPNSAVVLVISSGPPALVSIPNVVGQSQTAASTSLTNVGLKVGTITQQSSSTVASGNVITQSPIAGTSVANNSAVNLVISSGPGLISIPNVVGQTLAAATTALTNAGLSAGTITQQASSTVPAGNVISQSPGSGVSVNSGSAVNLVISSGSVQVATPNLVGLTQSVAQTAIISAQLTVGTISTQSSNTVPAGQVLSQSPAAGVSVALGSGVNLVVSSGPALISVPVVTGLTQSAAQTALLAANLTLGTVTTSSSATIPTGQVISQQPLAGANVAGGTAINIVISTGPATAPLTSLAITPASPIILAGNTQALTALGTNTDGTGQDMSTQVTWISSNTGVASVNNAGVVNGLAAGTATITANQGAISTSTVVTVAAQLPTDTMAPTATLTAPTDGTTVTTITSVTGTASDANLVNYVLDYAPSGQTNFTTLAMSSTSVTNGTLGSFDPTLLQNDIYTLRLTVYDQGGNSSQTSIDVQVAREQKVGNFSVGFQDLNIPVSGIPLTITRAYDTRNKTSGDFGFGWSLDLQTIRLRAQSNQGKGWQVGSSGGFFPTFTLAQNRAHKVSINMPDGHVEEFDMQPIPASSVFSSFTILDGIEYVPRAGTTGTLVSDQPPLFVSGSQPGIVELRDSRTLVAFDKPQLFQYTTAEGRVFTFQSGTLVSVAEPNGNTLTIGPNGLVHSSGKGVAFLRDAQGRITQITDPNGNKYFYSYDGQGNLATYTDALGNVTRYGYNANHGLVSIIDPRGITPLRNVYDDSGRLIQTIDSAGNIVDYTHNLNAQQEIIKDRLGNITVHEYDADGNVVKSTDALGGVTTRTYDANGNTLTETDPLGRTRTSTYDTRNNKLTDVDALGHVTTYTYDASNHPLTVTNPLGQVTTNSYDAKGNLLSVRDPLAHVTSQTYDASGRLATQTDALGNITRFQYDVAGNMTQQTDALGHVMTATFDANGNRLTETRTRTLSNGAIESLVTRFAYDAANRLIKTTNPDGSIDQTVYNAIGKQSQTTDALGHMTSYVYDDLGRLIKTTYPDGSFETSTYDLEGRKISSTDKAGHVTGSTFDALGRQTKTTYADLTFTLIGYDLAGQQITNTDALGHVTRSVYDAAGRRIKVVDASNTLPAPACGTTGVTCFTYDNAGKQTQITDANGNITDFSYDAGGRRTKVTYPDASTDQIAYDAAGRTLSKTDQAGKVTQFGYDALGHLIQVTDALNQITRYGYDDLGQQISQTDANNHTTTFAYSNRGQRISRTLPAGQTETMTYDGAGNLATKTDFNGKTITFAYDNLGRLITKTPDVSLNQLPVIYTYTDNGQRASMQDASGLTTYTYNNLGRLIEKASPQGSLSYSYDLAGNLASIQSSHVNGVSIDYAYDGLNRLASVTDNNLVPGTTTYNYDGVGNLAGYSYPNGVATSYIYSSLNRLTQMTLDKSGTPLASYTYTLGATGNRLSVAELGGRTVNYTYDSLYLLTRETVSADPNAINGQVDYVYDPVGNRLTRTSTLPGITNQTFTYDANDRLNTDTYDANGNTIGTSGKTYTFDFENHLTNQNGSQVQIVYDGDGNRVSETVAGVTTEYLVDTLNPTGYAQVLEEIQNGSVARRYTYGLDLISQSLKSGANWQTSFYGYDGINSSRSLISSHGTISDNYDYDSFGGVVFVSGATDNRYLFAGEELNSAAKYYYLRARYLNPDKGRFLTQDSYFGNNLEPISQNKYLYASANPVNLIDPSGNVDITGTMAALNISSILYALPNNVSSSGQNLSCTRNWHFPDPSVSNKLMAISDPYQSFESILSSGGRGDIYLDYLQVNTNLLCDKWDYPKGSVPLNKVSAAFGPEIGSIVADQIHGVLHKSMIPNAWIGKVEEILSNHPELIALGFAVAIPQVAPKLNTLSSQPIIPSLSIPLMKRDPSSLYLDIGLTGTWGNAHTNSGMLKFQLNY
jgi:RHS repeat-associated protein